MRTFRTGATRDTEHGKLDYEGFINPLCDYSFAQYMHRFRHQPDGTYRDSDNWQKGFAPGVALKSLVRHVEDVKLISRGYYVYEHRDGKFAERVVRLEPFETVPKNHILITIEDALNGVRFNCEAMKLDILCGKK